MKIEKIIAIVLTLVVISGCIKPTTTTTTTTLMTPIPITTPKTSLQPSTVESETSCESDFDCACGVHIETGDCFYGNKNYVDVMTQCPDFCTGFAGNLRIKCINNECKQVPIT